MSESKIIASPYSQPDKLIILDNNNPNTSDNYILSMLNFLYKNKIIIISTVFITVIIMFFIMYIINKNKFPSPLTQGKNISKSKKQNENLEHFIEDLNENKNIIIEEEKEEEEKEEYNNINNIKEEEEDEEEN